MQEFVTTFIKLYKFYCALFSKWFAIQKAWLDSSLQDSPVHNL